MVAPGTGPSDMERRPRGEHRPPSDRRGAGPRDAGLTPSPPRPVDTAEALARTARAVAAAQHPEEATRVVLSAVRSAVGAGGAVLLRAEGDRLVPVASDGLAVAERPMVETSLTPENGGGYPLVIGGRVEGVLLISGVEPAALAAQEAALVALLDLAAVVLRNARLSEARELRRQEGEIRSF